MQFADRYGIRMRALKGLSASCPLCRESVIAKCGDIRIWHWSHTRGFDCDTFEENETEWHRNWKSLFPEDNREVTIERDGIRHRADIFIGSKVVELQHSPLSPSEVSERESFYGDMVWIADATDYFQKLDLTCRVNYWTFNWKNARKWVLSCNKPVYLDCKSQSHYLFRINKVYERQRVGNNGWGKFVHKNWFLSQYLSG